MSDLSIDHSPDWNRPHAVRFLPSGDDLQVWWIAPGVAVPGDLLASEVEEARERPEGPVLELWRRTRRAVRSILGGILGIDPLAVCIERSELGKPQIVGADLELSVSHSGGHIVVAVSRRPVGVDIEVLGRERLSLEVADRYFVENEARWLGGLPADQLGGSFLRLWVAKEATLKCQGTGLAGYLERTECEHDDAGRVSAVRLDGRVFAVRGFAIGEAGLGAVVVEGKEIGPVTWVKPTDLGLNANSESGTRPPTGMA